MWKESTNERRVFMASDRGFLSRKGTENSTSVAVVPVSPALLLVLRVCCSATVQSYLKTPCHKCSLGGA